jgi:hypothetical protein
VTFTGRLTGLTLMSESAVLPPAVSISVTRRP